MIPSTFSSSTEADPEYKAMTRAEIEHEERMDK